MLRVETEVVVVDAHEPEPREVERAARIVREGGVVALPTDTVYGLVCDPGQPAAVDLIYEVKQRGRDLPLALLLHDMAQASIYARDVPENAVLAMQQFWPGALTVVVEGCRETAGAVCAGQEGIGLRLPAHVVPRLVAGAAGGALASTSANRSGQPAARTADEVVAQLGGLVPLVLDAGPSRLQAESTVVSFVGRPPRLLPG